MKQQQPISFYLDPVIWGDFQQPEPLTALRALTSMQLPPRTMSFIMKGVRQSPHAARHTHTHTHSEVRCSQGDKSQASVKEKKSVGSLIFLKSPCHFRRPPPPPPSLLSYSVISQRCSMRFINCTNFLLWIIGEQT